jgi:hypothetical protein
MGTGEGCKKLEMTRIKILPYSTRVFFFYRPRHPFFDAKLKKAPFTSAYFYLVFPHDQKRKEVLGDFKNLPVV